MFVIVPLIIVFLGSSYLYLNDDVGIIVTISIYLVMLGTVGLSALIFKKVQSDSKLQDINSIKLEILRLNKKIEQTDQENIILGLKKKIELLEKEILE